MPCGRTLEKGKTMFAANDICYFRREFNNSGIILARRTLDIISLSFDKATPVVRAEWPGSIIIILLYGSRCGILRLFVILSAPAIFRRIGKNLGNFCRGYAACFFYYCFESSPLLQQPLFPLSANIAERNISK